MSRPMERTPALKDHMLRLRLTGLRAGWPHAGSGTAERATVSEPSSTIYTIWAAHTGATPALEIRLRNWWNRFVRVFQASYPQGALPAGQGSDVTAAVPSDGLLAVAR